MLCFGLVLVLAKLVLLSHVIYAEIIFIQIIFSWKSLVSDQESKACIVNNVPFRESTNSYAVRNLLLHMNRKKEISVVDPPQNRQMRFGFYKASQLFIGKYIIVFFSFWIWE